MNATSMQTNLTLVFFLLLLVNDITMQTIHKLAYFLHMLVNATSIQTNLTLVYFVQMLVNDISMQTHHTHVYFLSSNDIERYNSENLSNKCLFSSNASE